VLHFNQNLNIDLLIKFLNITYLYWYLNDQMVYIVIRSRGGRRCGVRLVHSGAVDPRIPIEIFIAGSGFQIINICRIRGSESGVWQPNSTIPANHALSGECLL
jgi:hypothetical protein